MFPRCTLIYHNLVKVRFISPCHIASRMLIFRLSLLRRSAPQKMLIRADGVDPIRKIRRKNTTRGTTSMLRGSDSEL